MHSPCLRTACTLSPRSGGSRRWYSRETGDSRVPGQESSPGQQVVSSEVPGLPAALGRPWAAALVVSRDWRGEREEARGAASLRKQGLQGESSVGVLSLVAGRCRGLLGTGSPRVREAIVTALRLVGRGCPGREPAVGRGCLQPITARVCSERPSWNAGPAAARTGQGSGRARVGGAAQRPSVDG